MRRCVAIILVVGISFLAGCSKEQLLFSRKLPLRKAYTIKTKDGWRLNIWHYPPAKKGIKVNPVILCHGLSHNSSFWDLTEKTSLAKYLQAEGFDVWSVDLRGAGNSTKPALSQLKQLFRLDISALSPEALADIPSDLQKFNWTVDDHINYDVPAILDFVLKHTGASKVHWIGHSMGSMIMFGYLGTHNQNEIDTFVAISGPMYLLHPANDVYELMAKQSNFVKIGNLTTGTNLRAIVGVLAGGLLETPIDALFLNEDNVDAETFHIFYYACQEDISPGQLDQLLKYLKCGHFVSEDGKTDYTENVSKITVPVLQIVGQLDNMISPGFVAVIHNKLASKDKQMRVFGKINSYYDNYGHDDIIIGRHSRDDVFPYIKNWLISHPVKFIKK